MDRARREVEDHRSRERGWGNIGGEYWPGGREDARSGALRMGRDDGRSGAARDDDGRRPGGRRSRSRSRDRQWNREGEMERERHNEREVGREEDRQSLRCIRVQEDVGDRRSVAPPDAMHGAGRLGQQRRDCDRGRGSEGDQAYPSTCVDRQTAPKPCPAEGQGVFNHAPNFGWHDGRGRVGGNTAATEGDADNDRNRRGDRNIDNPSDKDRDRDRDRDRSRSRDIERGRDKDRDGDRSHVTRQPLPPGHLVPRRASGLHIELNRRMLAR
jgi:hypothetical protein